MTEPVSLAEAKAHLRISDDDPYVSSLDAYIKAARQAVEKYLSASIVNTTRTYVLDAFPASQIVLPHGPVTGITSITYIDTAGATQTLTSADVIRATYPYKDIVTPLYGASWPSARSQPASVTVTYTAGMMTGSPATLDESDIWMGILLTLGDMWENREGQIVGQSYSVNQTVDNLLHPYRRQLGI